MNGLMTIIEMEEGQRTPLRCSDRSVLHARTVG